MFTNCTGGLPICCWAITKHCLGDRQFIIILLIFTQRSQFVMIIYPIFFMISYTIPDCFRPHSFHILCQNNEDCRAQSILISHPGITFGFRSPVCGMCLSIALWAALIMTSWNLETYSFFKHNLLSL